MPTITARKIVSDAKTILQDTTGVRWPELELLGWVSAGQREIVALRPDAYSRAVTIAPTVGAQRQTIPADGHTFLEVTAGTTGRTVLPITRELLDRLDPRWRSATPSTEPLHYMRDPMVPRQFFLYPAPAAGTAIELVYSVTPPELAALDQVIALDDIYTNALVDFVLYRAYSKDIETVGNVERAAAARMAFEHSLGLKAQADAAAKVVAS